jgi:hypothetical protein
MATLMPPWRFVAGWNINNEMTIAGNAGSSAVMECWFEG